MSLTSTHTPSTRSRHCLFYFGLAKRKVENIPNNPVISNATDVYVQTAESNYVKKSVIEAIVENQKDLDIPWPLSLQKLEEDETESN